MRSSRLTVLMFLLCLMAAQPCKTSGQSLKDLQSCDPQIQLQSLTALEDLEGEKRPPFIPVLLSLLDSEDARVRRKAAAIVGEWQESAALPYLIAGLSDPDFLVRATSAWALGKIGVKDALDPLLKATHDSCWEVRCAAIAALGNFPGSECICNRLEESLCDQAWQVRCTAALQIGQLRCAGSLPQLHEILDHGKDREEVLAAACRSLGEIASPESLPFLLRGLDSENCRVAWESDVAVTKIAPLCRSELLTIFHDRQNPLEMRYNVGLVLGRIRALDAIPFLYEIAEDYSEPGKIRYISLILLSDFVGAEAMPIFLKNIKAEDIWVQRGAMEALAELKEPVALPALIELLHSDDPSIYDSALGALAAFDAETLEDFVVQELSNPTDDGLCLAAIRLAGTLKIKAAIPHLQNLRDDVRWHETASWALKAIER